MRHRDRRGQQVEDRQPAEDPLRDDRCERQVAEPAHPAPLLAPASQTASTIVSMPTAEAMSRCVCSKRIPPTIFESGNVNMLWPYVVGQSGTDSPDSVDVTRPPATISASVAAATKTAKACRKPGGTVYPWALSRRRRRVGVSFCGVKSEPCPGTLYS